MRHLKLVIVLLGLVPGALLAQGTIRYTALTTPHPYYPLDSVALRIYSPFLPVSYDLDFDSDGRPEYTFQSSGDNGFFLIGQNQNKLSLYPMDLLVPLPAGTVIGPSIGSIPWTGGPAAISGCNSIGCDGYFIGLDSAYAGLQFGLADGTHYGWVQISLPSRTSGGWYPFPPNGGWVYGYAWETRPDTPIVAGEVPEPKTWAILLGMAVLWALGKNFRDAPGLTPGYCCRRVLAQRLKWSNAYENTKKLLGLVHNDPGGSGSPSHAGARPGR